jgi:hypothetical protein
MEYRYVGMPGLQLYSGVSSAGSKLDIKTSSVEKKN